jgi:hypothetical protein
LQASMSPPLPPLLTYPHHQDMIRHLHRHHLPHRHLIRRSPTSHGSSWSSSTWLRCPATTWHRPGLASHGLFCIFMFFSRTM